MNSVAIENNLIMATNSRRRPSLTEAPKKNVDTVAAPKKKVDTVTNKAKDKLRGVGNVDTGDNFDKAWEKIYGSKEYRPSWVGKLDSKGGRKVLPPPPKTFQPKPTKTQTKSDEHTNGIPDKYRAKNVPEPLKIGGKVVPKEKELTKWKKDIETNEVDEEGKPVYNKVVKKTNVKGWMNNNSYWQPQVENNKKIVPPKPKKRQPIPAPKNQVINKTKYDLVGKFENKVQNPNLKLGAQEIPKEPELKKWGDDLEIPDDTLDEDYTTLGASGTSKKLPSHAGRRTEGRRATRMSHPQPATKNKKWNAVLETADVPTFFTKNTFWES